MKKYLLILLAALVMGCGAMRPQAAEPIALMGIENNHKGLVRVEVDASTVADGSFDVYVDMRRYKRTEIIVIQDGGSGAIEFVIAATWDPDADNVTEAASLDYIDIGLSFYSLATFPDPTEELLDDGWKQYGVTWLKLTFTVAGASADAAYKVTSSRINPGA